MKKSDWALIVLIIAVVGTASYFIVNAIVPPPNKNLETAETATAISSVVETPDPKVFNDKVINPTVKVQIGDQGDDHPFSTGQQ